MDRMRRAGFNPYEEDFMDDYGSMATRKHPRLQGRHFRCMFALTQIEEFSFETYVFPSPTDAKEFEELMEEDYGWQRHENLVFHTAPEDLNPLTDVLRKTLDEA